MSLYKRRLTQLDGKMGPALRVAYRDVGKQREPGGGSFAYRDVGKQRENGYGSFAPEKAPLGVARCLFGATKLRASRLDWRFFRGNSNNCVVLTGPRN